MTQGEYPYPPDEFDAVDPSAGPRGVHRRPRSRWATVWPYLAALAVSAVLAFAVVGYVWQDRTPVPAGQATTAAEPVPTGPAATGSAPAATEPAPEPPAEPTEQAPPVTTPPPPPPAPDLTTPVSVFNSTSVQGLAADAAEQLEDAGWTEVVTGNYTGGALASSTVFYGAPELEVSARAVADVLGITAVELSESDAVDGIDVVLELDFTR